jgi:predicted nucleic acid-binding protein
MANKALIDINVCLDFLLKREPFAPQAAALFQAAEQEKIEAVISAISFDTLFYLLRPELGWARATRLLSQLTLHTSVASVNDGIIQQALQAGWKDLEDAIQYFSAIGDGCEALVTRNAKDFTINPDDPDTIPVLSPQEYISNYL